jgi:lipoyl(octanoyl) transferase
MERDLAFHRQVARGEALPTLRFYTWDPPALSLGYFQRLEDVADVAACHRLGVDIVSRPTGGRALLHHRELTYSVTAPEGCLKIPASVLEAYRLFSRALVRGLTRLGVPAELAPGSGRGRGLAPGACFDAPAAYELQVAGKKVAGSAQMRRDGALLQHGSILFSLPLELYRQVLLPPPGSGPDFLRSLEEGAAGLEDLGYRVDLEDLKAALRDGFAEVLDIDFSMEKEAIAPWTSIP